MSLAALVDEDDDEPLGEEPPPDTERDPSPGSRDQQRSRRHHEVRAETINLSRVTKLERALLRQQYPDRGRRLPLTRAECEDAPRPCPYVTCRWHLYLDVHPSTGNVKLNFPDIEPGEMLDSCTLDVAERGRHTLEDVGAILNVTRERLRQIENDALSRLGEAYPELRDALLDGDLR